MKFTSSAASATADCSRFIETTVITTRASRNLFHVQRFGSLFRLGPFIFGISEGDDAGKLILSNAETAGRLPLTIVSFIVEPLGDNDAMSNMSFYDWSCPRLR